MSEQGLELQMPPPPVEERESIQAEFEKKVDWIKKRAGGAALLHIFSRFSGYCALTWATALILGGLVSSLSIPTFFCIGAILLLEGIRLFIIRTLIHIISNDWFRESSDPRRFLFTDKQQSKANYYDFIGGFLSSILSVICAVCAVFAVIMRSPSSDSHAAAGACSQETNAVILSFAHYIFGFLVCVNAVAAVLSAGVRYAFRGKCDADPSQNSLRCYFDEVFRTTIHTGLAHADRVDVLDFAFEKLASEFRRNIRPQLIKAQNEYLIRYLYHNQQGIAKVCETLRGSSNVWQQVVAATLPGFWKDEQRIEKQLGMFWALGERMHGAGKDAEGALNSIQILARSFATRTHVKPHPFLLNETAIALTGRSCIVSRLVYLICDRVRPSMVFQIRAFEACCKSWEVVQYLYDEHIAQDLIGGKLERLLESGQMRRGKIYVVSVLVSLFTHGKAGIPIEKMERFRNEIEAFIEELQMRQQNPSKGPYEGYAYLSEVLMVADLRKSLGMSLNNPARVWEGVPVLSDDNCAKISDVANAISRHLARQNYVLSQN